MNKVKKDNKRGKGLRGNKSGIELMFSTFVFMALAIILLTVLTIGFTIGWGKFWTTAKGYFISDIATAKNVCASTCAIENVYDFCCLERELDLGHGKESVKCQDERLRGLCRIDCSEACKN